MTLTRLHTAFRVCLALLLLWSPMASANAASPNIKTGGYFCHESSQTPSSEAQAHLKEFLSLVGDLDENGDSDTTHHCPDCFLMILGLTVQKPTVPASPNFSRNLTHYFATFKGFQLTPTGPPLGGRAPPLFQ